MSNGEAGQSQMPMRDRPTDSAAGEHASIYAGIVPDKHAATTSDNSNSEQPPQPPVIYAELAATTTPPVGSDDIDDSANDSN